MEEKLRQVMLEEQRMKQNRRVMIEQSNMSENTKQMMINRQQHSMSATSTTSTSVSILFHSLNSIPIATGRIIRR